MPASFHENVVGQLTWLIWLRATPGFLLRSVMVVKAMTFFKIMVLGYLNTVDHTLAVYLLLV